MNENSLSSPLASWSDPSPIRDADTLGLTAVGSAVFYRYRCSMAAENPDGVCLVSGRTRCNAQSFS